jgi:hypothetical protein
MTTRALALAVGSAAALAAAGCGGSSGSGNNGNGAPDAGTTATLPSGTVLGSAFQAIDAAAATPPAASCLLPPIGTVSVATLALGFGDHAGVCALVQQPCVQAANVRTVSVIIAHAGSGTQQPIGIGTYPITSAAGSVATDGTITLVTAVADRRDASCALTANPPQATGGTVNLTSVTTASVKGTVDITFSDGGRLTGAFSAPLCAVTVDVCSEQLPGCTATVTCNPG